MSDYETGSSAMGYDAESEADLLISRVIDDEATDEDRERFEQLAAAEPALWRTLALRQQDTRILGDEVRAATDFVEAIDLRRRWLLPAGLTWTLAASGWAAVLIVAVWWGLVATTGAGINTGRFTQTTGAPPPLTPEEHYRRYLAAPYVLGDMQPVVLEVEQLSDGRIAVHFVRRSEEIAFLDPSVELPVDESGELTKDPLVLREREPVVVWPN